MVISSAVASAGPRETRSRPSHEPHPRRVICGRPRAGGSRRAIRALQQTGGERWKRGGSQLTGIAHLLGGFEIADASGRRWRPLVPLGILELGLGATLVLTS